MVYINHLGHQIWFLDIMSGHDTSSTKRPFAEHTEACRKANVSFLTVMFLDKL